MVKLPHIQKQWSRIMILNWIAWKETSCYIITSGVGGEGMNECKGQTILPPPNPRELEFYSVSMGVSYRVFKKCIYLRKKLLSKRKKIVTNDSTGEYDFGKNCEHMKCNVKYGIKATRS